MIALAGQVVRVLIQLGNSALPGMGADAALSRLRQMLQQKQLRKDIEHAVEQGCQAFINEQTKGQAADLLHKLERNGLFRKNSPIAPALAELALNPTGSVSLVEQELERFMVLMVPDASAFQCKQLARSLITHVRTKVDAIPNMQEVQKLTYQRLSYEALTNLLEKFHPPLPDSLRAALLADAAMAVRTYHHQRLTSAHLLYALTRRHESVAHVALVQAGITPERAWMALDAICQRAEHSTITPTGAVERALMMARSVAGHNQAGEVHEAHILEALLDEIDSDENNGRSVRQMLKYLHTSTADIRAALTRSLYDTPLPDAFLQGPRAPEDLPTMLQFPQDPKQH